MLEINFLVVGDSMCSQDKKTFIQGNSLYYDLVFNFDSQWDGMLKHIVVQYDECPYVGIIEDISESKGHYKIPAIQNAELKIGAYGSTGLENSPIISTNLINIKVKEGAYNSDDITPLSQNVWEVYQKEIISYVNEVKTALVDYYTKEQIDKTVENINEKIDTKADSDSVYTKTQTDNLLDSKANKNEVYTRVEVDGKISDATDSLNSEINKKADKTYVNTELDKKANVSDVYNKNEIDNTVKSINDSIDKKANNYNEYGGFQGGEDASASQGGAIGTAASAHDGAAVGQNASAKSGGSIGSNSYALDGGAVGAGAESGDGFAGGKNAVTRKDLVLIDAIQLGTGLNSVPKSVQAYTYTLMNPDGTIPLERLTLIPKTEIVDNLQSTDANKALSANMGRQLNSKKADWGTTLEDYAIEDAYTRTEVNSLVNTKSDKVIITNSSSSTISIGNFQSNNQIVYGEVSSINVTFPADMSLDYISCLIFTTPSTIPSDYSTFPSELYFKGDDSVDGTFVPMKSMRYTMVFYYDGVKLVGLVSGIEVSS